VEISYAPRGGREEFWGGGVNIGERGKTFRCFSQGETRNRSDRDDFPEKTYSAESPALSGKRLVVRPRDRIQGGIWEGVQFNRHNENRAKNYLLHPARRSNLFFNVQDSQDTEMDL